MTNTSAPGPANGSLRRERVFRTLAFEEPDICPYYIWIDPEMMEPLARHYGDPEFRDTYIGDHTVMAEVVALRRPMAPELYRDDYGTLWRQGNIPHIEQATLSGPSLRGFENILADLCEAPAFVEELLDNLEAVCNGVIDGLLLLSPAMWRRFIKPRLARMTERIRRGGKKVYIHSCGHVTPIIPDLIEIGVDMLQPLQPEAMDIFQLKREFGRDLCLVGGISTQKTLPFASPADVVQEVRACLDVMARGGGYILAPAKPILPGVPLANAVALIDTVVCQEPHRS